MARRGGVEILAGVPLFAGLSTRHLKRIRDIAGEARYMAGAPLVKEGDEGDTFFVIIEGMAKVTVGKRTVHQLLPGDYFGEISLLDGGTRSASVISETPIRVLVIERKAFMRLLEQENAITLVLLEGLARTIRRADRSLAG
jgi:CRP-like cAMP-binding protein